MGVILPPITDQIPYHKSSCKNNGYMILGGFGIASFNLYVQYNSTPRNGMLTTSLFVLREKPLLILEHRYPPLLRNS